MKVSVHRAKRTAKRVEITLRRSPVVRVVGTRAPEAEPEHDLPELFEQPAPEQEEQPAPPEPPVEDIADADGDVISGEIAGEIEEIDEELAELEALIAAEEAAEAAAAAAAAQESETDELPDADELPEELFSGEPAFEFTPAEDSAEDPADQPVEEIFSGEPAFEFTPAEDSADQPVEELFSGEPVFEFTPAEDYAEEPVEEIFSGEPIFEFTPAEEEYGFADGVMDEYEGVDFNGDGVPEKGIFRRFFDRCRKKSDEQTADGVEYLCVDDDSGKVSRLCGIIKKHKPEEDEE